MKLSKLYLLLASAFVVTACGSSEEPALVSGVHLEAIDTATRPQDDFYQFANGGWLDRTEIPEIYSGYTVYHEVSERVEEALRTIVENAANGSNAPGAKRNRSAICTAASWILRQSMRKVLNPCVRALKKSNPSTPSIRWRRSWHRCCVLALEFPIASRSIRRSRIHRNTRCT